MYVPPEKMVNHDFMKLVLSEQKAFLPLAQVRFCNLPKYDELSVKKFWPLTQGVVDFMKYMPDPQEDGRLPERAYFWNVLNTVNSDYVAQLISHASQQRMQANQKGEGADTIEISEEMWKKLNLLPFVSCKYLARKRPVV